MPEQSKFSGALAKLNQRRTERTAEEPARTPSEQERGRGRGRPPGKRSDPEFKPTTLLLRERTKRSATRRLQDENAGQDLSDLVEQLLANWVRR
jgi:hypothetical protein